MHSPRLKRQTGDLSLSGEKVGLIDTSVDGSCSFTRPDHHRRAAGHHRQRAFFRPGAGRAGRRLGHQRPDLATYTAD